MVDRGSQLSRGALPREALGVVLALLCVCAPVSSGEDDEPHRILYFEPVGTGGCVADGECDDRIACTIDHCEEGQCVHAPCSDCCPEGLECIESFGCGEAPLPCETDEECGDDTPCTLDRCRDGDHCEHLPQDGLCEEGEICLAALGCIPAPPSECDSDDDCDMEPCLGVWYCDPEFACQFESLLECDDDDPCTDDDCDPEVGECVHPIVDADGDGHGDEDCGGDDCDDDDVAVHPGADEGCNGADDDCDGEVDEGCCEEGGPCTTTCGSEGTITCEPDGTEGCAPPEESCNALDDDCDGEADEGFDCSPVGSTGGCLTLCGSMGTRSCEAGCTWGTECSPPAEDCNGRDDDCDLDVDEGFDCVAGSVGSCPTSCGSTGTRTCLAGSCRWDVCVPPAEVCNGVDDDCDLACDDGFPCCAGTTRDCTALGFHGGTATCPSDCAGWNTSGCTNCGNFTVESGEDCDGSVPAGTTCADATGGALPSGDLACGGDCLWDTTGCTPWDPSGTWVVSPGVSQYCAYGLVNYSFGTLVLTDTGSALTVNGPPAGPPCAMTGPSAEATRTIAVSCTLTGGCDEIYSLAGTFTDDDRWTGTFTATFVGSCATCTTTSWSVTGTR